MQIVKITRAELDDMKVRYPAIAGLLETLATVNPTQIEKMIGFDLQLVIGDTTNGADATNGTPPDADQAGSHVSSQWRGAYFFPIVKPTPPWITMPGTPANPYPDSSWSFFICSKGWDPQYRLNCGAQVVAAGGDTILACFEPLYVGGSDIIQMEWAWFTANVPNFDTGRRAEKSQNSILLAKDQGIKHWIISLFNAPEERVPVGAQAQYIQAVCSDGQYGGKRTGVFSWATPDDVAFLVSLEASRRFSESECVDVCRMIHAQTVKRIIVGDADPAYLKAVASACKSIGILVSLGLETAWDPLCRKGETRDWPGYLKSLSDLRFTANCDVFMLEAWDPDPAVLRDVTSKAELIVSGYGSGCWA